jgi:hypothetical protein
VDVVGLDLTASIGGVRANLPQIARDESGVLQRPRPALRYVDKLILTFSSLDHGDFTQQPAAYRANHRLVSVARASPPQAMKHDLTLDHVKKEARDLLTWIRTTNRVASSKCLRVSATNRGCRRSCRDSGR